MWEPDEEDKSWEAEENTLIRDTAEQQGEWSFGAESSLIAVEHKTEEEEEGAGNGDGRDEEMRKENRDSDVWKELRKLGLQRNSATTAIDSTFSSAKYDTMEGKSHAPPFPELSTWGETPRKRPATTPTGDLHQQLIELGYPLKSHTVTVPDLGTFKLKQGFQSLVSPEMIKRMLSQSILHLSEIL